MKKINDNDYTTITTEYKNDINDATIKKACTINYRSDVDDHTADVLKTLLYHCLSYIDVLSWPALQSAYQNHRNVYHFEVIKYDAINVNISSITALGVINKDTHKMQMLAINPMDMAFAKEYIDNATYHMLLNDDDAINALSPLTVAKPVTPAMIQQATAVITTADNINNQLTAIPNILRIISFVKQYHGSLPDVQYVPEQQELFSDNPAGSEDNADNWPVLNDNRLLRQLDYLASVTIAAPLTDDDDDDDD